MRLFSSEAVSWFIICKRSWLIKRMSFYSVRIYDFQCAFLENDKLVEKHIAKPWQIASIRCLRISALPGRDRLTAIFYYSYTTAIKFIRRRVLFIIWAVFFEWDIWYNTDAESQLDSVHLSFLFYIVEAPFRINGEGQFWFMSYALRLKSSNIVYIIIVKIGRLYLEIIILFGIFSAHKK